MLRRHLLAAMAWAPTASLAARFYRYQDSAGNWHFSDIPPAPGQPATVTELAAPSHPPGLRVETRRAADREYLELLNDYPAPVQVELSLSSQINTTSQPALPLRFLLAAHEHRMAVQLGPRQADQPWSYRYQSRHVVGDPDASHRPERPYRLPFGNGERYRVDQGWNGEFSHQDVVNRYAVDLNLPEGTPVYAARQGVVVDVNNGEFSGGDNLAIYAERANMVRILHPDGTLGVYVHLYPQSALVRPGDQVFRGQSIARSGNTGYSTGPHLHFAVERNQGMRVVSVPFRFDDGSPGGVEPVEDAWLSH